MIYVMSDIHGRYDKFLKMIDKINLKETDELYILGDVIDRGPQPLDILDYIRQHSNIHLLMGNHELLFLYSQDDELDKRLWYKNGGEITDNLINERGNSYRQELVKYIKRLPKIKVLDKFILVHAGMYIPENSNYTLEQILDMQDEDILLWDRSFMENDKYLKDYTIICGHTNVQDYIDDIRILRKKGKVLVDCGCNRVGGKLACLRLDDMKEFLV